MSRDEGFDVMDVSTAIAHDPKFRRLAREHPELVAAGFTAYVSTMAESWKAGARMTVEDAWPQSIMTFDGHVVAGLKRVKLLTAQGYVTPSAWRDYFERAKTRREATRDRWRRANDKRASSNTKDSDDTALSPRGSDAVTAANPLGTESESDSHSPRPPRRRRGGSKNGRHPGTSYDAAMVSDDDEPADPPWLRQAAGGRT